MPRNPLWDEMEGFGPHPGYLGGLVCEQPVLLREANLVAFATGLLAFPSGLLFTATVEQALDDGVLDPEDVQTTVRFSDGTEWSSRRGGNGALIERASEASSGDGGASWTAEYWLPELPPEGPVAFAVRVADYEGKAMLSGDAIVHAAGRAVDLWA